MKVTPIPGDAKSFELLPETEIDWELLGTFDIFRCDISVAERRRDPTPEGAWRTARIVLSVDSKRPEILWRHAASEAFSSIRELHRLLLIEFAEDRLARPSAADPKAEA